MAKSAPIRVMIVDDYEIVRRSLVLALNTFFDFQVVAQAANGAEALELCAEHQPEVVLMDLYMPKLDGVAATAAIRQHHPQAKVILLSSFDNDDRINAGLEAGASCYLFKNVLINELAQAIRKVHYGGTEKSIYRS